MEDFALMFLRPWTWVIPIVCIVGILNMIAAESKKAKLKAERRRLKQERLKGNQ